MLYLSKKAFPHPENLEVEKLSLQTKGLSKLYWIYLIAISFIGLGYSDFALMAYHFQKTASVSPVWIPFFYSIAMGTIGITALIIGKLFDTKGIYIFAIVTAISSLFAPFVFLGHFYLALIGTFLWGIGMGAQGSIMRAMVAAFVPTEKRGSAYGIMNLVFGVFWAIGSAIMGVLYDKSLLLLVLFSVIAQLLSLPLFLYLKRKV
jgi:MFS family permease